MLQDGQFGVEIRRTFFDGTVKSIVKGTMKGGRFLEEAGKSSISDLFLYFFWMSYIQAVG